MATRSGSMPGSERAKTIAARQSSSWCLGWKEVDLAAAVAEAAVVEDERGDAGGSEALRERSQRVAAGPGEAVGHDDDRCRRRAARGRIEPGGAAVATRLKDEVLTIHAYLTGRKAET